MRDMKEEAYICKLLAKVVGYFTEEIEHFSFCVCLISFFYHFFFENRILFGFVICSRFLPPPPHLYISLVVIFDSSTFWLLGQFFLSLIEPFWIELFFFYIFTCIDRSFFNWLKQEEKNWWSLTSSIRLTCRHHPGSFEMRSIPCRFKTKQMLCDDFLILWIALQYVRFISDRKKYKKGYDIKTSSRKNQLLDTHTN